MSFIKKKFDEIRPLFEKGGKYEKFYEVYEAHETLFLQPNEVTKPKGTQIRCQMQRHTPVPHSANPSL